MNVIILMVDALRFDVIKSNDQTFMEKYGVEDLLKADNMNALAKTGLNFSNACSVSPETPTSHATLFTGTYPPRHGIHSFFHSRLTENVPTIFEIFGNAGYETICAWDKGLFHNMLGLSRGAKHIIDQGTSDQKLFSLIGGIEKDFVLYQRFLDVHFPYFVTDSQPTKDYLRESYKQAKEVCDKFGFEFILKDGDYSNEDAHTKQWFIIKNSLYGKEELLETLIPLYIKSINYFDKGRFKYYLGNLKKIGALEDSVLVLLADHGESVIRPELVKDGKLRFDHCYANTYDLTRIPLVVKKNGLSGQKDEFVSNADVLPTLAAIAGINAKFQGRNLLEEGKSIIYSEHAWWNNGAVFKSAKDAEKKFSGGVDIDYLALMRQRSIIINGLRYVETGEPFSLRESEKLSDEQFVREMYRKVIADWDNKNEREIARMIKELKSGDETRKTLLEKTEAKAKGNNRYALYDIQKDPYETKNLLIAEPQKWSGKAEKMRLEMYKIIDDPKAPKRQPIKANQNNEVKSRLEALGYL